MLSDLSTSSLTMTKWCKYTLLAQPHDSARSNRPSLQGRILPPFSIFSRYCWSTKITFDQGAMRQMVRWSTPSRTREEDSIEETEGDIVSRPESATPTIGKRRETHQRSLGKGEPSRWNKSSNNPIECGYCGNFGHYEEECRKKKRESASTNRQLMNYATHSDHGGMFIMRHKSHSMTTSSPTSASALDNVWFLNSGASNHMTSHEDWF